MTKVNSDCQGFDGAGRKKARQCMTG